MNTGHDIKPTVDRAETARAQSDEDKNGKRLQFMSKAVTDAREKKERERIKKEDAASRGELVKQRRVVLTEDDLSPYWPEHIPAQQIKAELLRLLEIMPISTDSSRSEDTERWPSWDAVDVK